MSSEELLKDMIRIKQLYEIPTKTKKVQLEGECCLVMGVDLHKQRMFRPRPDSVRRLAFGYAPKREV
jgi:hypothetical protein